MVTPAAMSKETKYIAIKVKDLSHWLWFERTKVTRENGNFTGVGGWGDDGAYTEISVDESLIEGEILSDALQY